MAIWLNQVIPSWKRRSSEHGLQSRVAGDEPGDVDGEEAAAVDHAGGGEDDQGQAEHDDRIEAGLQLQAPDDEDDQQAAQRAAEQAEPHLPGEGLEQAPRRRRRAPAWSAIISTSVTVMKIAIGSFEPDSTSSVERTLSRMVMPPTRSRKNTAAASVELTIEPSSSASQPGQTEAVVGGGADHPRRQHARPRWRAPAPARSAVRMVRTWVLKPLSNRMTASASEPMK